MSTPTYNRIIRKMVSAFGGIFNNITLVRYNPDTSEAERMKVPIAYASKERYVTRLENDPYLDKKVNISLPRMSFELNGISYDASRKQLTNIKNFAKASNANTVLSQYNPVPYDFDFSLYLYVRNIEDGTQLIEHILPFFTPDYTLKLNLIPEMGVVKNIPVLLKDTQYEIKYEGDREQETRSIIWTLNFTVKGFIYGAISEPKIIKASFTNIFDDSLSNADRILLNMSHIGGLGSYQENEYVYQGYSFDTATATARVVLWDNVGFKLTIDKLNGNFVASKPLYGAKTGSVYTIQSAYIPPQKLVQIVVTPEPPTANASDNYTYNTVITEFPDI